MSWSLVTHVSASGAGGGSPVTSSGINTTGATFLIATVIDYSYASDSVFSDSKGNTWTRIFRASSGNVRTKVYICLNPVVGSGHTFTATDPGSYPAFAVQAYSGLTSGFYNVVGYSASGGSSGTTLQPGSVAYSTNALLVACVGTENAVTPSINSGFTSTDDIAWVTGQHFGVSMAYLLGTAASSVNPTWTWSGSASSEGYTVALYYEPFFNYAWPGAYPRPVSGASGAYIGAIQPAISGGTAYTLTLDAGSYAITGAAATLLANRQLTLSPGSYSITGADATLLFGHVLTLGAGSYSITGADATLLYGHVLTLGAGSYSITGADATLLFGHVLTLGAGTYSITGADATLVYTPVGAYTLDLGSGTYSITGANATLLTNRQLTLSPGAYSITGADATLLVARTLSLDPGTYAITGADATLLAARTLSLDPGTYTVVGADATLIYVQNITYSLTLDPGTYSVTGASATLTRNYSLTLSAGTYSVTGFPLTIIPPTVGPGSVDGVLIIANMVDGTLTATNAVDGRLYLG